MTGPSLELDGVAKAYGSRSVLRAVSIAVHPGELVALLGPNGAGKTTAVEILEGYRRADGGTARVLGEDPRRGGPRLRARMGLMLQGGGLDPRSTPRDTLRLYARFHDGGRDPERLLAEVGLARVARTSVRRLSGGERQRLALAVALVGEPEVLVLDEPTAGMDPEARRTTRALIAGLRAEGRAILLTTHDLGDVERLADRVAILHDGRIVAAGTPAELAGGSEPRLRFRLARGLDATEGAGLDAALAAAAGGAAAVAQPGAVGTYRVDGAVPDPDLVAALATWCAGANVAIVELRSAAATLEERYLELTGDRDVEAVP
ncbi:MAG TPA: ABC transporter ATP-binding protein [Candidatus Sulfomarinibacteraceae bacterium]|nr:ABC transporter ATP-binding protein [Candidatus Sulfomarinibacteraceae bacterium]